MESQIVYRNQKIIKIKKSSIVGSNVFLHLDEIFLAMKLLKDCGTFKLWMYLNCFENNHCVALSRKDFCEMVKCSESSYHRYVKALVERGFLVKDKNGDENSYIFYSKSTKTESEEERQKDELNGYIYIIEIDNYYKIGKTKNFKDRVGVYTKLMQEPKIIINQKCKEYSELELKLHSMFTHKRTNGEWFKLDENDIEAAIQLINENKIEK